MRPRKVRIGQLLVNREKDAHAQRGGCFGGTEHLFELSNA
jgi:hypothetical protein